MFVARSNHLLTRAAAAAGPSVSALGARALATSVAPRTVTLLEGDSHGCGPEAIANTVRLLAAANVPITWDRQECKDEEMGSSVSECTIPKNVRDSIERNRVVLKGSYLSAPIRGHNSFDKALAEEFSLYAQVVPVNSPPLRRVGLPRDLNFTVVRENTEEFYVSKEHEVVPGVVESLKVVTEEASLRIARFAFDYASKTGSKRVVAVHKANIMKMTDGLFLECVDRVSKSFPDVKLETIIVDNASMQLVSHPEKFSGAIVLTPNLYGAIVNGICSALTGGMLGGFNVGTSGIAVFEQGHRYTSLTKAGKNVANPGGMFRAALLMLRHLGMNEHADRIDRALNQVLSEGDVLTPDLGGHAKMSEFTDAVIAALK